MPVGLQIPNVVKTAQACPAQAVPHKVYICCGWRHAVPQTQVGVGVRVLYADEDSPLRAQAVKQCLLIIYTYDILFHNDLRAKTFFSSHLCSRKQSE